MRTVILITGHYLRSKRRAGFHWIADALHRQGQRVIMMTAPISWVSWLRRDHRFQYGVRRQANRLIWEDDRLASYVWWTPMHPVTLKYDLLNRLAEPVFQRFERMPLGPIEDEVKRAHCFVFESNAALVLAERFCELNSAARLVYRVSDDLRTLRVHPSLHEREKKLATLFDCISSPTASIHEKFAHLPSAQVDPHGVPVHVFDTCAQSPYDPAGRNCVFVGVARLDRAFLKHVSRARPDVAFHIIGPFEKMRLPNVHFHGELPFEETVPFVRFADVGLQTITGGPGAESFVDSLKMLQYSYCRLPIIAPSFLRSDRDNIVTYSPNDASSMVDALERALAMEHRQQWQRGVQSWDDLARRLVTPAHSDSIPTIETVRPDQRSKSHS